MLYTVFVFIYASVPRRAGARNAFYRQGAKECAYMEIAGG